LGDKDYYRVLEVHLEASVEMIKKAYQTLALRYHPDKHIPAKKKWAEEKFKQLSEAYQILSDPIKRRDYDREGYSEQVVKESSAAGARDDEEAYFYYRMGLGHYQNARKKTSWRIFFGVTDSDLEKAREDFATVLDEYPTTKYSEEAYFYYICTLIEEHDYSQEFLKDIEEEFVEFFGEFPRGRWAAEVKLRQAKFYLFKKRDYSKAGEILTDFVCLYPDGNLTKEAKVLLEYAKRLNERSALKVNRKKKSG